MGADRAIGVPTKNAVDLHVGEDFPTTDNPAI